MKRRVSMKRRLGKGKGRKSTQRRSPFGPRPFPADINQPALGTNQAQQERIARSSPNLLDIPLFPPTVDPVVAASTAAGTTQMQPDEANLQPPQGTIQRQQVEEKQKQEELQLAPQTPAPIVDEKQDEIQAQKEDETIASIEEKETEEEEPLQAKAEAEEIEEEADQKIQAKEEEKEKLQAKLEAEKDEEML